MSLNEELFPTTHEPERGPGRGSSEDDRETRHAPAADPGSGSGIPRRKRAGRPATTNPRRLLRVRGENRATVRLLAKVAGLSRAQITRLLQQHRTTGEIADRRDTPRRPFPRRYSNADIGLLAELRPAGEGRQGPAAPLPGWPACHGTLLQQHRTTGEIRSGHAQRALRTASSAPALSICSATAASNAWPASPTAICTTCGTRQAINGAAERRRCRRARCRS